MANSDTVFVVGKVYQVQESHAVLIVTGGELLRLIKEGGVDATVNVTLGNDVEAEASVTAVS